MARPTNRIPVITETEGVDRTELFLRDLGADDVVIATVTERIDDREVQGRIAKLRAFAEENPTIVLGALSALLVGGAAVAVREASKKRVAKSRKSASKSRKTASKSRKSSGTKARKSTKRSTATKRTLIEPHAGDKRYIRRDAKGRIKESVDVGRSLSADARSKSKTKSKPGFGDKGDR